MAESRSAKNRIGKFLDAVSKDYTVYAPTAENGIIAFRRATSAEELAPDYRNSTVSPKDLFLPKAETVYEFDGQDFVDDVLPEEKRVIFGIRPCDCRALTLLDKIFDTQEIQDPFYSARRENTVLVAMGCDRPLSTCFCTAVGGDPFGEEGPDVLLLGDAGEALLAKTITPKGKDFVARYAKFFSDGGSREPGKQAKQARDKIVADFEIQNIAPHLDKLFENDIWETVSRKCLGCGTCSYLCPTCYCFDLVDEKTGDGVKKIRKWDCCMFPLFTHHASGHNPRSANAARLRQKIMHKFNYFAEEHGVDSCVGCGRCVRNCPVNLDIRQLLAEALATPASATEE